jgi:hypothetical protein
MSIQTVTSTQLQQPPTPVVRTRTRTVPAVSQATRNSASLDDVFTPLLQDYAQANAVKNRGTREEKKAKDALNKALVEHGIDDFSAMVEVDGNRLQYEATIAESSADEIDVQKVFELVGRDIKQFMALCSVTKKSIEDSLGKNAVIMVSRTVTKPAALSVTLVK